MTGTAAGTTAALSSPRRKKKRRQKCSQPWFHSQPSSKSDTEMPELKLTSSPQLPFKPSFLTWEMTPRKLLPLPQQQAGGSKPWHRRCSLSIHAC